MLATLSSPREEAGFYWKSHFQTFNMSDREKGESEPHGNVVRKGGMAQILISVSLVFKYFYSQVLHVSPKK